VGGVGGVEGVGGWVDHFGSHAGLGIDSASPNIFCAFSPLDVTLSALIALGDQTRIRTASLASSRSLRLVSSSLFV